MRHRSALRDATHDVTGRDRELVDDDFFCAAKRTCGRRARSAGGQVVITTGVSECVLHEMGLEIVSSISDSEEARNAWWLVLLAS